MKHITILLLILLSSFAQSAKRIEQCTGCRDETCLVSTKYDHTAERMPSMRYGNTIADTTLANLYFSKAESFTEAARYDSAIYYYNIASEIYLTAVQEVSKKAPNNTLIWKKHFFCQVRIAQNYYLKVQYNKAILTLQKVINTSITLFGSDDNNVVNAYNGLGIIYWRMGKYNEALSYFKKALKIAIALNGNEHIAVATAYNNIGGIYHEKGDYYYALGYYQQSLKIAIKVYGKEHLVIAVGYNNIGLIYSKIGGSGENRDKYDLAMEYLKKALKIRLMKLGKEHPLVASSYNNIASIYYDQGEYSKAMEYDSLALSIRVKTLVAMHPEVATSYTNIGDVFRVLEEYNSALECQYKALKIYRDVFGGYHPDVGMVYRKIAVIYTAQSKYDTALFYFQQALGALVKEVKTNSIYINPELIEVRIPGQAPKYKGVNSNMGLLYVLEYRAEAFYNKWKLSLLTGDHPKGWEKEKVKSKK
ncbi:MAG: tetratricopeptide repeat protein [Cytophagales bacterium]|nr:tetratricopeptide repeat protein [Cytophagales bacterium]